MTPLLQFCLGGRGRGREVTGSAVGVSGTKVSLHADEGGVGEGGKKVPGVLLCV